jgi:membrane protease YdiL (CAAX protease family)
VERQLESLVVLAFVGLLLLLRFDAQRFGAAEYDDEEAPGGWRTWLRRVSWYASGIVLIALIYRLHDRPLSVLRLQMGDDLFETILAGLAIGAVGTVLAFAYGYWRHGELRLPPGRRYPAGLLNSIGTAFIDEATFRGIVLGLMLAADWPADLAIGSQAVLYGLATRLGGRGRPLGMLGLSLLMGLIGGWVTVQTGGIGAAFLGHALTRFAIFAATGHAGQLRQPMEDEEPDEELEELAPNGWEVISDRDPSAGSASR